MSSRDVWEGRWKQVRGRVKETWGDLTDDDLDRAEGNRDQLIGKIQEKTGQTRQEIERQFDDWMKR
ncbi:MAG: CsbD family protein [Anaerolineae bacterium]